MADAARDLARLAAALIAAPTRFASGVIHRMATGDVAVLQLRVGQQALHLADRHELLGRLRRVEADDRVAAILLHIEGAPGGWASTQDLRDALRRLSERGTRVYALLESAGNAALYLASACDHVFLVPSGEVAATGVAGELTFMGGLLERLGVEPDFEAAGAYKSFAEPFTRRYASAANREATRALVDDLHAQLVDGIADGRGIERSAVEAALDRAPLGAEEALELGLVDELRYEDEVIEWLEGKHGKDLRRQPFASWARRDRWLQRLESAGSGGPFIAVVHLEGAVTHGEQSRGPVIRARTVVPLLRALREEDEVAAIVLHVDSPGGSALASDLIWREVARLAEEKPLVACFEDVAASGGFYLAAPAREIVARAGTLTGSIGVVGGKLVLGEGLRMLGVSTEAIANTESATMYSASSRFTDAQRERFRASLQRTYDGFVERVAKGRGREVEAVEPYCRGRVWTGRAALEHGLVDRFGGLPVAVERARSLAAISPTAQIVHVDAQPRVPFLRRMIANSLPPGFAQLRGLLGLGRVAEIALSHPGEALALCPYDLDLR
ncbi:MAG: S49 family peptidase [Deltaproteobacteria bacterium]|nr:MAG: S49 family peptidase [Deltaproteobacteria bacterium]